MPNWQAAATRVDAFSSFNVPLETIESLGGPLQHVIHFHL